jgi:SAM-dependent methyltransferase
MTRLRPALRRLVRIVPWPIRRRVLTAFGRPVPPPRPRTADLPTDPDEAAFKRAYVGGRPDLVSRVPANARNVLDLGCATGEVGLGLKARIPGVRVVGVEIDAAMAAVAAGRLERVVQADLGDPVAVRASLAGEAFDAVVAGDILEHLTDPWAVLRTIVPRLADGATVVASLPNGGFWNTWWNVLVRKRWPYRSRGMHDATHLRFFARRNLAPLFAQAGLTIERIDRAYRLVDRPHPRNRWARRIALPGLRDLLTYQFIVVARRPLPSDDSGPAADPERARRDGAADALLPP